MRLATFFADGIERVGLISGDGVVDLTAREPSVRSMRALLEGGAPSRLEHHASAPRDFQLKEVVFRPVVSDPRKIFLILLNYEEDRIAQERPKLQYPHLMSRFPDTQVGHEQPLVIPAATREFDFEGEIAVIIGRGGFGIPRHEAMAHVAGYACYNDCAARDFMRHTRHFTAAKGFPASAGFGPWLTTTDEAPAFADLELVTRLNGEIYQQGRGAGLTYPVEELIEYISGFTELFPGDVIATGSPGGAGHTRVPPRFLLPGDRVDVEISGLGVLANDLVAQA